MENNMQNTLDKSFQPPCMRSSVHTFNHTNTLWSEI